MASGNSNVSNSVKEQLLVCWLEPQSDAGKVSAIPASWIVSTVSGDGRSPDSVVRCRWPRTRRLYRARIVSSASKDASNEDSGAAAETSSEKGGTSEEPTAASGASAPVKEDNSMTMVKEETKSAWTSQSQQIVGGSSNQQNSPAPVIGQISQGIDATTLAHALMPTLKKLFTNELSKLSTDIQANFDIIGHKISALDGTVKCIKTRVDRMEILLNTAAQELGDSDEFTLPGVRIAAMENKGQSFSSGLSSGSQSANVYRSTLTRTAGSMGNQQPQQQRRPQGNQGRLGNQESTGNSTSASSYSRYQLPSMVTTSSQQRPHQFPDTTSNPLKRRRPSSTTNPPLPKAVVITAPNGIEIYLGGDKNYKMPLVMYKDALKNCTRPVPTYMVMALIRRCLTPDQMSRTWLTEQQLLGKKDGMLLDPNLLSALKKQALMQFPGTLIDDRLLARKLYDVFHGIRRQMRKKGREAGNQDYGGGDAFDSNGKDDAGSDDLMGSHEQGVDDGESVGEDDGTHEMEQDCNGQYGQELEGEDSEDMGHDGGLLNGDNEDLEEMAARHAAFWAGTDENY